jgi:ankyrin repeat protein
MQELFEAIKNGDSGAVAAILADHPEAVDARNENNLPAVVVAHYYGRPELARLLLEKGAQTDIFAACALGLTERATELLNTDRTLLNAYSPDGWTPLHLSAFFGHKDLAELLLERGAKVHAASLNAMRNTPLHAAVARSQAEVAALLIARGADVNAKQHGGWTPLHAAAANGREDLARMLLAHGAEPFAKAENSQTPLDMALTKGHEGVVRMLEETQGGSR